MSEIWKDIPGFEGRYQASTLGRIRSLAFSVTIMSRWGKPMERSHVGKILSTNNARSNGYLNLMLGKGKTYDVHRLIATTFIPVTNAAILEVNHIDFNKHNNAVSNLEWVDRSQQRIHNIKHGRHNTVKLTPKLVLELRTKISLKEETMVSLAKQYGISYGTIKLIKKRKIWNFI